MTEPQFRKLLKIWQKRLGLNDWRIIFSIRNCDDRYSVMEVIRSSEYYKRAELIVPPWMFGIGNPPEDIMFPPDKQWPTFMEESLVHELLHLVTNEMSIIVREDICTFLHRDVYTQVYNSYRHAEERMVDNLSVMLVRELSNNE